MTDDEARRLALADLSARIRLAVWPVLKDRPEFDELVEPAAEMAVIRIGLERERAGEGRMHP